MEQNNRKSQSLVDRVKHIEENIPLDDDSVISKIKEKQQKEQIKKQEHNFLDSLHRIVDDHLDDFFKVVLEVAEFIESEVYTIQKLFGLIPNSENKLILAIELLRKLYDHFDREDEAKELIHIYCDLSKGKTLLNRNTKTSKIEEKPNIEVVEVHKKKKNSSLKRKKSSCLFF